MLTVWLCVRFVLCGSEALHATNKDLSSDTKGASTAGTGIAAGTGTSSGSGGAAAALKGLDAFTLDYRVNWPLSLVLSKRSLTKYQLLFQHLFKCKHVRFCFCFCSAQFFAVCVN